MVSSTAFENGRPARPFQQLMRRETQATYGIAPRSLFGPPIPETTWQMEEDRFLLRGEGDHYFYYRKGEGITIERGKQFDASEESLWLNGTLYSAIASMNGLLPIHASAVAHNGSVIAFTGPAGAGKSTLVAALASRGLPMFCDDTLVLDLSEPDRVMCLPGHKRLKLRPDAIGLTGALPQEKVSRTVDKFYARPAAGDVAEAMPIGELIFLEEGPEPSFQPITGGERLARLRDDHQTAKLFAGATRSDAETQFNHLARLARQIGMARFRRPIDARRFGEGVELAVQYVVKRGRD